MASVVSNHGYQVIVQESGHSLPNYLEHLGRVDLCCTNFGLNGSVLIANQLCRPSGLSQRAVTKSKMLP